MLYDGYNNGDEDDSSADEVTSILSERDQRDRDPEHLPNDTEKNPRVCYVASTQETADHVRAVAQQILQSKFMLVGYFVTFFLQTFVVIWTLVEGINSVDIWVPWVDVAIVLFLSVELVVHILAQPDYFSKCRNIVDFVILILCIAGLGVYLIDLEEDTPHQPETGYSIYSSVEEEEEEQEIIIDADTILMILRYIVQFVRIGLVLNMYRWTISMQEAADIAIRFGTGHKMDSAADIDDKSV